MKFLCPLLAFVALASAAELVSMEQMNIDKAAQANPASNPAAAIPAAVVSAAASAAVQAPAPPAPAPVPVVVPVVPVVPVVVPATIPASASVKQIANNYRLHIIFKTTDRAKFIAALHELIPQVWTEADNLASGAFQDATDPNSFAIIETWATMAALNKHFTAPHSLRFFEQIKDIKAAETDLKYGPLAYGAGCVPAVSLKTANNNVRLHGVFHVHHREKFIAAFNEMAPHMCKEPGNVASGVFQDITDPKAFAVVTTWRSMADVDKHFAAHYTLRFLARVNEISAAVPMIFKYVPLPAV